MRCVSRSRTSNSRCVCPGPNYVSQPKVSVLTSLLFCLFLFLPASFQYCCVPCATRPTVRGAITTRLSVSDYVHWLAFRYRTCSSASVSVFASVLPQTVSPIHLNTLLLPLTSYHLLRLLCQPVLRCSHDNISGFRTHTSYGHCQMLYPKSCPMVAHLS